MNQESVSAEWMGKDVQQTDGLPDLVGRRGVVQEVFKDEKENFHARMVKEVDGTEWYCPISMLKQLYTKPHHLKFVEEVRKAGFKVRYYEGRNNYVGPAVEHSNYQMVIKKVTMPLMWDNMGKSTFVVHPR